MATFKVGTDETLISVSSEGSENKTVVINPQDPIVRIPYAGYDDLRGESTVIIYIGGERYETEAEVMVIFEFVYI